MLYSSSDIIIGQLSFQETRWLIFISLESKLVWVWHWWCWLGPLLLSSWINPIFYFIFCHFLVLFSHWLCNPFCSVFFQWLESFIPFFFFWIVAVIEVYVRSTLHFQAVCELTFVKVALHHPSLAMQWSTGLLPNHKNTLKVIETRLLWVCRLLQIPKIHNSCENLLLLHAFTRTISWFYHVSSEILGKYFTSHFLSKRMEHRYLKFHKFSFFFDIFRHLIVHSKFNSLM